jgi:hypothetical protein
MQPKYKAGQLVIDAFSGYPHEWYTDAIGVIVSIVVEREEIIIYKVHWRKENLIESITQELLDMWCIVYDESGTVVHGPSNFFGLLD